MEASSTASSSVRSSPSAPKVNTEACKRTKMPLWRSRDVKGAGRLSRNICTGLILNTWSSEIVALLLSLACTTAIVVVLRIYNGEASPKLPYGITLNAVVSVLATASKTSLLYLVGSAISQLKWCWFQKYRRLQDMQSFDDASRGPWGSLILLFELKWKSFASIGASITVLALAFDPFVQQVINYPKRARAESFQAPSVRSEQNFVIWQSDFTEAVRVIEAGIWSKPAHLQPPLPTCPTGHCEWPKFSSLEWCTKCANVTDSTTIDCSLTESQNNSISQFCHISMEPDLSWNETFVSRLQTSQASLGSYYDSAFDVVWPIYQMKFYLPSRVSGGFPSLQRHSPPSAYLDIRSPFLVMGHATWQVKGHGIANSSQVQVLSVEQCVLTPCLKQYSISVLHGTPTVKVDQIYGSLATYVVIPRPHYFFEWLCWENGSQPNYSDLHSAWKDYTNMTAGVICSEKSSPLDELGPDNVWLIVERLTGRTWTQHDSRALNPYGQVDVVSPIIAKHNLSYVMENIAQSLNLDARERGDMVSGQAFKQETFVRVRWEWLILPIVLDVAGFFILMVAILSSRYHKARLWKASLLPLLYHGMENKEISVATDVQGMEEVAREDVVTLDQSSADRIVLQNRAPS